MQPSLLLCLYDEHLMSGNQLFVAPRTSLVFVKKSISTNCSQQTRKTFLMSAATGLREIVSKGGYDGILLDQFGVIHDGQRIFPPAVQAMSHLHNEFRHIVILSNSSKRSHKAYEKLESMGVDRKYVTDVITSGQLAHEYILRNLVQLRTKRLLHINWNSKRGVVSLEDYNLNFAPLDFDFDGYQFPNPRSIDVIIAHGTDGITDSSDGTTRIVPFDILSSYVAQVARHTPSLLFLCANPDVVTVDGAELRTMPGALARAFEEAGGTNVLRLGKPSQLAYDAAIARLKSAGASKFLAIGDSLAHDILGAHSSSYEIDSVYIAGGIDAQHFDINAEAAFTHARPTWNYDYDKLIALAKDCAPTLQEGAPTYVLPFLRW